MFGTLFDEETKHGPSSETVSGALVDLESAPSSRPDHLICGLNNQGTTCYLNSLIQTLFFTPEFREAIFSLTPEELGLGEEGTSNSKTRVIIVELQHLFARMLWLDISATSTSPLTSSFGWVEKEAFQQHDAQELMRILFDAIHTSLFGTSCSTLISDLYGGSTVNKIVCKSCGNVSENSSIFLDVNVTVTGYTNLVESLSSSFIGHEIMEGVNQYLCNKCDCHVDAIKETKIRSLPPILVLSLMRLGYDTVKRQRYKETGRFEFPKEINMNCFCEKDLSPEEAEYELFAVVSHSGSSYCGHYNVYVQDVEGICSWKTPVSKCVVLCKREESLENNKEIVQNYKPLDLLLYIFNKKGVNLITLDELSNEISKELHSGWNKKFKKRYGSLNKFIRCHSDKFDFSTKTNTVKLKKSENYSEQTSQNETALNCDFESLSLEESKSCSVVGVDVDKPKQCWFDINDATVTPIFAEDIELQYGGRGSAYMLFFRRKVYYKSIKRIIRDDIPNHLIEFVQCEKNALSAKRQDYETAVNQVLLFIHFGANYLYEKGVLKAKQNELNVAEMKFDRRRSIHDLRDEIISNYGELCGKQISMHKCKELSSTLHLYEDLLKDNITILDCDLVTGSRIFVWNGKEVNGVPISLGEECEPIFLKMVVEKDDKSVQEIEFTFPKNFTLKEVLLLVGKHLQLWDQKLYLASAFCGNEVKQMNGMTEDNTLQELQFRDGDCLYLDLCKPKTTSNHNGLTKAKCDNVVVSIENRCQTLSESSKLWPVVDVFIDKTALVSELKALSILKLSLNGGKAYRLKMHKNILEFNIPLHENKAVEDLGLILQSGLILEEGHPPSENEIVLSYSGNFGSGDAVNEVTVNDDFTVRECLEVILLATGVKNGEWYLQRVNTFGDPAAILSKTDSTLASEGIKHGDHLLVREGHLVPYGYLSFTVELYPSLLGKTQTPGKYWTWVMDKLYKHQNDVQKYGNKTLSAYLGEVEIPAEATLENLKQQILTLPRLAELELYSQPQHVRLRLLNNGRPGHVLRGHKTILKKLKLIDQSKLCVQILAQPEDLSADTVVVEVVEKIANTNRYTDPVEVLWDTRNGTLNCLRHTIANQLFLTENCLRLAKYLPEDFNWLLLLNHSQNSKNYKSFKRKNKSNIDLRNEPFLIRDGVRIAIQDVNQDTNKDFSSEDDIINRQRLEEEKENKQKEMCLAQNKSRPPEVGIKIKVGDFS